MRWKGYPRHSYAGSAPADQYVPQLYYSYRMISGKGGVGVGVGGGGGGGCWVSESDIW